MFEYAEFSFILLSVFLTVGLAFLFFGGEALCKGAAGLALHMNINPIIIGLTIVALATSMPELVTSLYSAFQDAPGIAVGNIVGSNLANVGLVLGIAAVIAPIKVHARLIRKEVPILMGVTLVYWIMGLGGVVSRVEGIILLVGLFAFLILVVRTAREDKKLVKEVVVIEKEAAELTLGKCWIYVVVGAVLLHFGAEFLVNSSIQVASRLGVSETLIGLTIVAIGTSLPELAASISAARRGHSDICVGNVIGSNLFNILFIGGTVSTIAPLEINSSLLWVDYPAMILMTAVLWYFFVSGHKVTRREGVGLIGLYFVVIGVSTAAKIF